MKRFCSFSQKMICCHILKFHQMKQILISIWMRYEYAIAYICNCNLLKSALFFQPDVDMLPYTEIPHQEAQINTNVDGVRICDYNIYPIVILIIFSQPSNMLPNEMPPMPQLLQLAYNQLRGLADEAATQGMCWANSYRLLDPDQKICAYKIINDVFYLGSRKMLGHSQTAELPRRLGSRRSST